MHRREFLKSSATGALAFGAWPIFAAEDSPLNEHRISALEFRSVKLLWPRHVGRNAVLGHHGRGPTASVCILKTDRGAIGWGHHQSSRNAAEDLKDRVVGQPVASLIDPKQGITKADWHPIDVPLHDLAGNILGQPVWKMLAPDRAEPFVTKVYSGMIYFDDLDPAEKPAGIDKILENCQADVKHGYRQLKVKIGRGHKWMPAEAGLKRDIDVARAIHEAFPKIEILVDANNGYTVETAIRFLEGIQGIPLFWFEEPFHETVEDWKRLASWMKANGYEKTYRADGEARTDFAVIEKLTKGLTLNLRLDDICGYGFSKWRKLMPKLKEQKVAASPHTWGSGLKTVYTAHFAGAVGNHPTIEGVTCGDDDVDFGENKIVEGQFQPSTKPGFGLTLKS